MHRLWRDIQYGIRMLARNPGFTLVAAVTLTLGIGANTAIFSLVDELLVRPLPVLHPKQLVNLRLSSRRGFDTGFSYPAYLEYRDRNDVFSGLIGHSESALSFRAGQQSERIDATVVTGNYFSVLGVDMALGRGFLPEENQTPNTHPVAVISHRMWQNRFGADPGVIDKTINLNGYPFTIVGVAPAEFNGTVRGYAPEVYLPAMMLGQADPARGSGALTSRGMFWLNLTGRLKPGVSMPQAEASLTALKDEILGPTNSGSLMAEARIVARDGSRGEIGMLDDLSFPLKLLMAVVGLVLLIACANVANLLLARATGRQKEIAVRLAVGASRAQVVKQMLTEGFLLSAIGGGGGLMLALWLTDLLRMYAPPNEFGNVAFDARLNLRVLGFALALSVLTTLIFGLAPALSASKLDLVPSLKDESASRGWRPRRLSLKNLLVVAQVALSFVVLASAGLCLKSLYKLNNIDAGFDVTRVFVMSIDLGLNGYKEARGREFYAQLLPRVAALPGVESASMAAMVPLASGNFIVIPDGVEGYQPRPDETLTLHLNIVGDNYFRTIGVPLLAGRDFGPQDNATGQQVAIINETMARRYWSDSNPIGKHIDLGGGPKQNSKPIEIIGIVRDSKYNNLTEEPAPVFFQPLAQGYFPEIALHVRTAADARTLIPAVRHEVQSLDSNLPVFNVKTLSEQKSRSLYTQRMVANLLAAFGLLALALAAVGIYGLMAYSVNRRTREIGLRMALGAQVGNILALILRQGLALILVGVVAGLGGAWAATRLLGSFLFGVSTTDPITFGSIAFVLIAVAWSACYIPARRATKIDPMAALKYE